jgi:hypothetical protein
MSIRWRAGTTAMARDQRLWMAATRARQYLASQSATKVRVRWVHSGHIGYDFGVNPLGETRN